jgi:hypothetical protein
VELAILNLMEQLTIPHTTAILAATATLAGTLEGADLDHDIPF